MAAGGGLLFKRPSRLLALAAAAFCFSSSFFNFFSASFFSSSRFFFSLSLNFLAFLRSFSPWSDQLGDKHISDLIVDVSASPSLVAVGSMVSDGLSFSGVFISACKIGMVCDLRVKEVGGAGRVEGEEVVAGDASGVRVVGAVKDNVFCSSGLPDPVA